MPFLSVQTNQTLADPVGLAKQLSGEVADLLGKPEAYVMVRVEAGLSMTFAGDDGPCVYLELKSIGLPGQRTKDFSSRLCGLMEQLLGVSGARVYIEFSDAPRNLWGWNGSTF